MRQMNQNRQRNNNGKQNNKHSDNHYQRNANHQHQTQNSYNNGYNPVPPYNNYGSQFQGGNGYYGNQGGAQMYPKHNQFNPYPPPNQFQHPHQIPMAHMNMGGAPMMPQYNQQYNPMMQHPMNTMPHYLQSPHTMNIPVNNHQNQHSLNTNLNNQPNPNNQLRGQPSPLKSQDSSPYKSNLAVGKNRVKSSQVLEEIEEKKLSSQEANSHGSARGQYYSQSQGTDSHYYSTASMPNIMVAKSETNSFKQHSSSIKVNTWSGNKKIVSNGSTKDAVGSQMFLAPPGVKVQADMNTGISFDELQNIIKTPNHQTGPKPNLFNSKTSSRHRSSLGNQSSQNNLKQLANKMKNRKSLFSTVGGRPGLNISGVDGQNISNIHPAISMQIPSQSKSPEPQQVMKGFQRSPTMPNAGTYGGDDLSISGGKETVVNPGSIYNEGGRRASNFSIPFQHPDSRRGSLWNFQGLPQDEATRGANFNLYAAPQAQVQVQPPPYQDRRRSHMLPQAIYPQPWPQVQVGPRRSSEILGNPMGGQSYFYGQQGYNPRVFDPLQAPKEESEQSVDSSVHEEEHDSIRKESNADEVIFKDNSLNSEESREIMTSGSLLTVPVKEKQRVKSFDLREHSGSRQGNNSGSISVIEETLSEKQCSKSQADENEEINESKSKSSDNETDLLKECFEL